MSLKMVPSPLWVYAGAVRLRLSGGRTYIHLSPRVVEALGAKHVVVRAVIEPVGGCENNVRLPLGDIIFKATLTKINGTYRVTVPKKIGKVLVELSHCIILHVYIAPITK
jgi:predicted polyphosphate/ATP-dependent NAD kinase